MTTGQAVLRPFESGDQEAVRGLVLAGLRERWGEAFDPTFNADVDDVAASYVARGATVLVAEGVDGRIVGVGVLLRLPDGSGRLVRVSVDADARRRGHGRRLVEALVEVARSEGRPRVRVLTDTPWTSAVALYRACGFVVTGQDDRDIELVLDLRPVDQKTV